VVQDLAVVLLAHRGVALLTDQAKTPLVGKVVLRARS
jgi:hypothetical protein